MLDLGTSFVASVARDPEALAIVDGDVRLSYLDWYRKISALVAGFDELGLACGDHIVGPLRPDAAHLKSGKLRGAGACEGSANRPARNRLPA